MQIYLDSRPEFQSVVDGILERIQSIRTADKDTFLYMRANKTRIAAAALALANQTPALKLYELMKTVDLPTTRINDDRSKTIRNTCIHITPVLLDHVKAGMARMNIEILGELEDNADPGEGQEVAQHMRRINERQYMHLVIYYLHGTSDDTLTLILSGSAGLHPMRDVITAKSKSSKVKKKTEAAVPAVKPKSSTRKKAANS